MQKLINNINKSFEAAKKPPVHPTNPNLTAVAVLPLLPNEDLWGNQYTEVVFDFPPVTGVLFSFDIYLPKSLMPTSATQQSSKLCLLLEKMYFLDIIRNQIKDQMKVVKMRNLRRENPRKKLMVLYSNTKENTSSTVKNLASQGRIHVLTS